MAMICTIPVYSPRQEAPSGAVEAARRQLRRSPYRLIRELSCCCSQGMLVLRGRLPSFYLKQVAQETVLAVAGQAEVVNETEVIG